ncbi:MAG: hypothetical protein C0429_08745 [Sphingopyxis sp.]|nr:hypothetical protein [Sphingopyxis sp.]
MFAERVVGKAEDRAKTIPFGDVKMLRPKLPGSSTKMNISVDLICGKWLLPNEAKSTFRLATLLPTTTK